MADIVSLHFGSEVEQAAKLLIIVGIILSLPTMLTGMLDLGNINTDSPVQRVASVHMNLVLASWTFYAASLYLRLQQTGFEVSSLFVVLLSVSGFITLCLAGWYGGKMVYEYGVGVQRK